jgi:hydroxymethylbilane synthase
MDTLRLGTRGSQLALYQAHATRSLLRERAGVDCEIVVIRTSGDRLAEASLSAIGGKRLFVKEIEDALLEGAIDLAVHSSKDMPAILPDGLAIGAVLPREDARDVVVMPGGAGGPFPTIEAAVAQLGQSPRIGTSSVRRTAQLRRLLPAARFLPIRGNLDTRLRKVDSGEFDAIVLAAAGLRRLERADRISAYLPSTACVPAPGQGIIAIEIREDDRRTRALTARIDDPDAAAALTAERALVRRLGGGCQMPIGAYAKVSAGAMTMTGVVVSPDGSRAVKADAAGSAADAAALGAAVAERLLAQGAAEILEDVQRTQGAVEGIQP